MYTDEDNSTDLIGAFCELLFPRKGHSNGIIVDDYGTEWLVQLTNGKEVPVYKDEVFIVQIFESPSVAFDIWALSFFWTAKTVVVPHVVWRAILQMMIR